MTIPPTPRSIGQTNVPASAVNADEPAFAQPESNRNILTRRFEQSGVTEQRELVNAKPWAHFVAGGSVLAACLNAIQDR